ncbi:aminoacyl-tRNA deacylase [Simiduia aestuariiviva]|uniref:Ala-tRNA(Pro) deacylase n=1 Tax=Simiduia aestuariiviva TaxID=1510459 RepID=A0A839UU80_9GAMM|nr:YbaK/EbsC family protein [Simiduia aestuariiviva]MBB3169526.1 Ala-tRNA(Pro) deacylase [Simiduia aestuariiviva]
MEIAQSVAHYLESRQIPHDVVDHPQTQSSLQTARSARIAPSQLAKAVVVKEDDQFIMCILPATHLLVLEWLDRERSGSHRLALESELDTLFPDCATGAIPALGQVYGMKVIWDNSLNNHKEIYFEAGNHRQLVHLDTEEFMSLMCQVEHATIACPHESAEFRRIAH